MKNSNITERLRNGGIVLSAKINLTGHRIADITAKGGFDCLWLDMEHSPNGIYDIECQIFAAKANDAEVIVRVPRGSYSDLIKPLEAGAQGIMIPHVMSAEDAKNIAYQTRFHPLGRRPLDGGNADNSYGTVSSAEYTAASNRNNLIIVQIEDPEAIAEIDEISSVEGIDVIFFGPGDYSHALGVPGQLDDPRVREARAIVARSAIKHGKIAGTVGSPVTLPDILELGYRYINVASDVCILRNGMRKCSEDATNAVRKYESSKKK